MEILGGPLFAVAGGGESHGPAIVTVVFGCPAGLNLKRSQIQAWLDRRRPGSTKHGTTRREADRVALLSGLFSDDPGALLAGPSVSLGGVESGATETYEEGFSTGEPIAALVLSTSKKSTDYTQFKGPEGEVRPGHTDLVKYHKSSGYADIRGSGRSSYRSTISDVIGGSIARVFLREHFGTRIFSSISQVGPLRTEQRLSQVLSGKPPAEELAALEEKLATTEIHTIDPGFAAAAVDLIRQTRIARDSLGAAIDVVAFNPPALAGEPLYNSLKMRLMGSLGGLHAVQGCEAGDGFEVVGRRGSENNDSIRNSGYQSNSHGGLIGGVTTGMPIVCRVGFKPTSSIPQPQKSVRKDLVEIDFQLKGGRHDPCVGIRAGITLESRLAIELANAVLCHQAGRVHVEDFKLF